MGTTLDALKNDDGLEAVWVLVIEGVSYLLTSTSDTSSVTTAWAATDWSTAYPGLSVSGTLRQSIKPFDPTPNIPELTFTVMDTDGADTFGVDIHNEGSGNQTLLNETTALEPSDTTAMTVVDTGTFDSSGTAYVGQERIDYTGTTSTTFTGLTRGRYSPFGESQGKALDLEADDSGYGSITDAAQTGLDLSSALTFVARIKLESTGTYTILSKWGANPNRSYFFQLTSTTMVCRLSNNGNTSQAGSVSWTPSVDTWYEIAVTWESTGGNMKFYVNGAQQGATQTVYTGSTINNGGADFEVGREQSGSPNHFDGVIDEVQVWSSELSAATLLSQYLKRLSGTESNLQTLYHFDDDATDATSNSNDLTLSGGTSYVAGIGFTYSWARNHTMPTGKFSRGLKQRVSSSPRTWVGKWVGLWMHRVSGGVLDVKSEAQLVFSGKIEDLYDTPAGDTVVVARHVLASLVNTTILHDQFQAKVLPGVDLYVGQKFTMQDALAGTYLTANDLDVVTGASGANELEAGSWSLPDLLSKINAWLASEKTAARLNLDHSFTITAGGYSKWSAGDIIGGIGTGFCVFPASALNLMGFGVWVDEPDDTSWSMTIPPSGDDAEIISQHRARRSSISIGGDLELSEPAGVWFNNTAWLAPNERSFTGGTGDWGYLILSTGQVILAKRTSDTLFTDITIVKGWGTSDSLPDPQYGDDTEEAITVKQMVLLNGPLKDIVCRLLASTGSSGYNHATFDDFPGHMGAGIPYELLGSTFEDSLDIVALTGMIHWATILIEKPTKLLDLIKSELILRGAFFVWKNGTIRIARLIKPVPTDLADHTLDETSKAAPDSADNQITPTRKGRGSMVNVVKIEYNREINANGTGKYLSTFTVRDQSSIADFGESKSVTIRARNVTGDTIGTVKTLEHLAVDLIEYVMPLYSRPMTILERTISMNYFEDFAPGDHVDLTDSHARNPLNGTRGLTNKSAVVLSTSVNWGGNGTSMLGQVTLLVDPFDDITIYSPTADVDDTATNAGYNAGTKTLTCYASKYSEGSEAADASHFAAGDKILITERDPATAGSPDQWSRTIDSVSGNDIVLTTTLSSPAWDTAKYYRVTSEAYSNAVATQKTDAYQADDADLQIEDTREPYVYSSDVSQLSPGSVAATELPERYSTSMYGDGVPLSTGYHRELARMVNNLVNYRCAPRMSIPMMEKTGVGADPWDVYDGTGWQTSWTMPVYFGAGDTGTDERKITLGVVMESGSGTSTASARFTLSASPPVGSYFDSTFRGRYSQVTFTTTATTPTKQATQELDMIAGFGGIGFLTLETKSSIILAGGRVYGLTEWILGALE